MTGLGIVPMPAWFACSRRSLTTWRGKAAKQAILAREPPSPLTPALSRAQEREITPLPEPLARLREREGPAIAGG